MAVERNRKLSLSKAVDKTMINGGRVLNPYTGKPYTTKYFEILEKRRTMPVWQHKAEFLRILVENQTIILVGGDCSGKTTQIPQFMVEAGYTVASTHPRGQPKSVSEVVAEEMDVMIGDEVGYNIRFEDCSGPKTILKFITDDMLLRETMTDPLLKRYGAIILNVPIAQDRSLDMNVLFGLLKKVILKNRPELKLVVIINATLEAKMFKSYFNGASLMKVPGRFQPMEIFCSAQELVRDYLEVAIQAMVEIHIREPTVDILVFLAREDEIEDACKKISRRVQQLRDLVKVVPLYSSLPPAMQHKIFDVKHPSAKERKIVVSANIAETSVTIDGIVYVIDPQFAKQEAICILQTQVESLVVSPISKARACQKEGRASRSQPRKCFMLHTKGCRAMIEGSNLANVVLTLKRSGIDDLEYFDFMDPRIAPEKLRRALELLHYLAALDDNGNVTKLGQLMSEFPLDPQMSKMLVVSPEFNCSNEILSIAAMLLVPNCFFWPWNRAVDNKAMAPFYHIDGDHLTLLNVYNAYKEYGEDVTWCANNFIKQCVLQSADNVRTQLVRIMNCCNLKMCNADFNSQDFYDNIRKAVLVGYFMQVAHLDLYGHYLTIKDNQMACLSMYCCLDHNPTWVVYNDFSMETIENFIHKVMAVRGEWLIDIAPHYYDLTNFPQCEVRDALERLSLKEEKEKTEVKTEKGGY